MYIYILEFMPAEGGPGVGVPAAKFGQEGMGGWAGKRASKQANELRPNNAGPPMQPWSHRPETRNLRP